MAEKAMEIAAAAPPLNDHGGRELFIYSALGLGGFKALERVLDAADLPMTLKSPTTPRSGLQMLGFEKELALQADSALIPVHTKGYGAEATKAIIKGTSQGEQVMAQLLAFCCPAAPFCENKCRTIIPAMKKLKEEYFDEFRKKVAPGRKR